MSSLASRLEKAFDARRHSQAALARAAGVKAPSVNAWFSGETKTLKAEPLVRAALYLGVSPLWLATGEGPMHPDVAGATVLPVSEPTVSYSNSPLPGITPEELALLDQRSLEDLANIARGMVLMAQRAASGNAAPRQNVVPR